MIFKDFFLEIIFRCKIVFNLFGGFCENAYFYFFPPKNKNKKVVDSLLDVSILRIAVRLSSSRRPYRGICFAMGTR